MRTAASGKKLRYRMDGAKRDEDTQKLCRLANKAFMI